MLGVIMLNVFILIVLMLNVIILSVIMLNVLTLVIRHGRDWKNLNLGNYRISFCSQDFDLKKYHISFFENFTIWGQECQDRWVNNTIWYKFPTVTFQEVLKLYCLMFKFLICNCLFLNVRYETDIFVVKIIQIWDYIMKNARFMCANQGQINILEKIMNGHNLRFSPFEDR